MSSHGSVRVSAAIPQTTALSRVRQAQRRYFGTLIVAFGLILFWQALRLSLNLPAYKLPDPLSIVAEFTNTRPTGELVLVSLAHDLLVTWSEALCGFVLGASAGFMMAIVFTQSRLLARGLLPYVIMSQTIPILAIAPMVVVGVGQMGAPPLLSKAIIAAYLTFFPVTINALRGLKSVEPDALDLMRSYAASERDVILKLRIPNAIPYLFTALKISATASVIGAIVAELPVGSNEGIGSALINGAQYNTFQPAYLWATIITAATLGLLFYGVVALAEKHVVKWQVGE
ncbi:MAG: ABC transporter permease [Chloroflexi bacterium]|nr:ABC transporter permease [Chloroflexota bacterium]